MTSISISPIDRPTWLLIALIGIALLQVALFKVTGVMILRQGYMGTFMGAAAMAYLMLHRDIGVTILARAALYAVAVLLMLRYLPLLPNILFGEPRAFDVLAFYLPAKVASADLNLYSPENYAYIASQLPIEIAHHFRREIIDVGFMYPPPTALLFLPMALLDFPEAARAWYMFVGVTIVAACALLARMLLWRLAPQPHRWSLVDVAALVVVFVVSNSSEGWRYGQTTALLACMMILTIMHAEQRSGGIAAALGLFIKPIAAVPAITLLIGRHWASVVGGLIAGTVIIAASLVVLGVDDWKSYLGLEFSTEAPPWLYNEAGNHSLLAVLIRAFGIDDVPWGYGHLVVTYAVVSALIFIPSAWLAIRTVRSDFASAYCLMLVAALLIYPGTLYTYSIMLTVPIAVEFANQLKSREHYLVTVLTFSAIGALWHWTLFAANVFLLLVFWRRALLTGYRNSMPT